MIEFWLPGRGIGKARPRFGKGGRVHTSERYGAWKAKTIVQITLLKLPPAPIPAKVECLFVNFLSSDVDNLVGSVLDSLVQAHFLRGDSSSYVVGCSGRFVKIKRVKGKEEPVGIIVRIYPAVVEYLSSNDLTMLGFPR